MDPETEKIIREQMGKLPDEIRNLFTDPALGDKILNIGRKNGIINIEQLGTFQTETNLMMLGLVHPDEYPNELKNQLKLSDEKVNNIVNDINEQILSGIREKLKEVYETTEISDETNEKPIETREELLKSIETPTKTPVKILDLSLEKELPTPPAEKEIPPIRNDEGSQRPPVSNGTSSILAQKLSGSFVAPKIETDHSLNNMTKDANIPTKPSTGTPRVDPYRMPID